MTEDQLEKMRECARRPQDNAKTVRIACKDGDVLQGSTVFVSDAERDVIFELESSNNPTKYQSGTHYLIKWDDITDFQELNSRQTGLKSYSAPHQLLVSRNRKLGYPDQLVRERR